MSKPITKVSVFAADPPWDIEQKGKTRGAAKYYNLMSIDKIKEMGEEIRKLSAENAHLYLWTTNAALPYAFDVIREWGFTYRSIVTWIKDRQGLGVYFRNQTEQCLFATRGKAPIGFRSQPNVLYAPRQDHSHKPEELYAIIDRMSGHLGDRKLELFARRPYVGWEVWGNEIDSDVKIEGYEVPSDSKFNQGGQSEVCHEKQ